MEEKNKRIKKLYKYRPLGCRATKHTFSIIESNELWFENVASLNDPFDTSFSYSEGFLFNTIIKKRMDTLNISKEEAEKSLGEELLGTTDNLYLDLSRWLEKRAKLQAQVCCMSKNYDCIVMWSHYASSHTGVVIEFTIQDMKLPIEYDDDIRSEYLKCKKVDYSEDMLLVTENIINLEEYLDRAIYTKYIHWEYEGEYRFILFKPQDYFKKGKLVKFEPAIITKVLLGKDIKPYHEDHLRKICKAKDIPIAKMIRADKGYRLEMEEIA